MSKRSRAKKQEAAKRKENAPAPAAKATVALPPANPPRPNMAAFYVSSFALAVWIMFLVWLAVLTLRGG